MSRNKLKAFIRVSLGYIVVACLAGMAGWFLSGTRTISPTAGAPVNVADATREGGYNLVNPLLVCTADNSTPSDESAQTVIQNAVNAEVQNGDITTASVYYRHFMNNSWAILNGNETYYPASLNKIPLAIAYYNWVEETDFPFTKSVYFPTGLPDENAQQEIQPEHPLQPGQSYTVTQLIDAMIKDSDNNATLLLLDTVDTSTLAEVFGDLNVPFLAPGESPTNYMHVSDFAFFFRVLYNGTYLSHDDSEKVLEALTQTTFNNGLVAGVPSGTTVAHKFGLVSIAPTGTTVTARELHDCGIVYPTKEDPYLLCVMTKSTGSLQGAEHAVADISRTVYQYVTK